MMHTPDITPQVAVLSPRQIEAVRLLCLPQKAAAYRLGITVGAYKQRIRAAIDAAGVANAWELTAVAARSGVAFDLSPAAQSTIIETRTKGPQA